MARRMGKTADDQYMGGGSGNFNKKKEPAKKAEKKERVTPPKPRAKPAKEPAKAKKSTPPKPRAKPAKKEAPKRTAKDKDATPKAGSARKAVATSGASRSTAGKEDRGFVARVVRGTKRVTGNARNVVSRGFKRNRPR